MCFYNSMKSKMRGRDVLNRAAIPGDIFIYFFCNFCIGSDISIPETVIFRILYSSCAISEKRN